jgi:hypothetical protein
MMYVHLVWYQGRNEPERILLRDRNLYDEFLKWLQNQEAVKGGWYYEHDEGSLTVINFQYVTSMMVRPQPETRAEPSVPPSAEHSLQSGRHIIAEK